MKKQTFLALALMGVLALPAEAGYDEGLQKLQSGDARAALGELTAAAREGDSRAQYLVGIMYHHGMGVAPDAEEGIKWLRHAAALDEIEAQVELAQIYQNGRGVAPDPKEAARWYGRAAELGHVGAQLMLADLYAYGRGVPNDYWQAYKWYEVATDYWGELVAAPKELAAKELSPTQIASARQAAQEIIAASKR